MITGNNKLSDIISNDINLLPITHRLGITYNMGEQSISEACIACKKDERFVLAILNTYSIKNYFPEPEDLELEPLIGFLTLTHNYHKEVTIPGLFGVIEQLKKLMPGEKLLIIIEQYLNQYIKKLIHHIDFEEREIFPLVNEITKQDTKLPNIKKLLRQHTNVENELSDLKTIITRHIPENLDLNLVYDLLHTLSHFEKEQLDHARFEDKILIPKLFALISK